jgi:hypothetical protein
MRGFLDDDESDGILLIDADNAFNRINRAVALRNMQYICPAMKHVLINFYRSPTRIFMNGDGFFELLSQEGTTQGCPLAMAMYALALVPLSKHLQPICKQVWYADDATGCDSLEKLHKWFNVLLEYGPQCESLLLKLTNCKRQRRFSKDRKYKCKQRDQKIVASRSTAKARGI